MIVRNRKSFIEPALVSEHGEALIRCSREHLLGICQDLRPRHLWFADTPAVRLIFAIGATS
jgi:hypothetical protein